MKYFAYGSNMNFEQMRERCPEAKFMKRAHLENYRFVYDGGCGFWYTCGNIAAAEGDIVWGGLFDIHKKDLTNLDEYERYKERLYERQIVLVKDDEGNKTKAIVYIRPNPVEDIPGEKYQGIVLEGAKDCGLPEDYIQTLDWRKIKELF